VFESVRQHNSTEGSYQRRAGRLPAFCTDLPDRPRRNEKRILKVRPAGRHDIFQLQEIERRASARFMQTGMPEIVASALLSVDMLQLRMVAERVIVLKIQTGRVEGFVMFPVERGCAYIKGEASAVWQPV